MDITYSFSRIYLALLTFNPSISLLDILEVFPKNASDISLQFDKFERKQTETRIFHQLSSTF